MKREGGRKSEEVGRSRREKTRRRKRERKIGKREERRGEGRGVGRGGNGNSKSFMMGNHFRPAKIRRTSMMIIDQDKRYTSATFQSYR